MPTPSTPSTPSARLGLLRPALLTLLVAALVAAFGPMTGLYAQDAAPVAPQPEQPAEPEKDQAKKPKQTLTDKLGGTERYLTHLSTDKPIYRIGETVYARGTILHAFTNKPIDDRKDEIEAIDKELKELGRAENDDARKQVRELWQRKSMLQQQSRLNPFVEIKDPKGATVGSGRTGVQDSVFGFKWEVPDGQAGGEYTIKVTYPWSGLAPVERKFDIRAYRAPRIKTQIDFLKDGYGPGDTVVATVKATRAEGGIPVGAKVTAIARVDGKEVARKQTMVRETGVAEVRFDLPAEIDRGEGSLVFVIEDGGVVESASKTLPILLQTVDLQLFPEGGDLVAGVENRVYFEAKTPYGKPADIKGEVLEFAAVETPSDKPDFIGGKRVGTFETTHEGRGIFSFVPNPERAYVLRVAEPASVTQLFHLPAVHTKGATIQTQVATLQTPDAPVGPQIHATFAAADGVYTSDETIGIRVYSPGIVAVTIELRQREQVIWKGASKDTVDNDAKKGAAFAIGVLPDSATGILTVTAYDADGKPLAERLIYRAPKNHVNIQIMPDSAQYTPSGQVQLTIKTTDSEGNPVAAVAGLTVTDDAVLEMIETREQAPSLPAMVFLEQEVKDLADAHVYLDANNPDAAQQLDLLLGTQGWRRFALVDLEKFIVEHGDDARRLFAFRVPVQHEFKKMRNLAEAAPGQNRPELFLAGGGDEQERDGGAALDPQAAPVPKAVPAKADGGDENANQEIDLAKALDEAKEEENEGRLFDQDVKAEAKRMAPQMVFVREYAHKQPAGKPFGERSDFTETVYWSSGTKTNEQGLATVTFDLSDSVTSFRVKADAFTAGGALGAGTTLIESVRPFYVEPKLPLELTAGDKVLLPIAMINNTDRELPVQLILSKLGQAGKTTLDPIKLGADERGRTIYELALGQAYGDLGFTIEARAGQLFDQNKRSVRVVPRGFPISEGSGGMLTPGSEAKQSVTIPATVVPGSLQASVTVYPTPLANLTEALEALIRQPSGCFEQTSSTSFPLVMAQQYFLTHQGIDPELIAKAKTNLDAGYKRLIGFETEKNGYEWFGSTPPHEALTAYGLLQFNEMKQVMDVDQKMIDRTADWLMSRMDEDGSFKLDKKALDSFGRAPQDTTNAYIVWSMLEAGYDPAKIQKSIDLVLKKATEGDDAYVIALGANIAATLAKRFETTALLTATGSGLAEKAAAEQAAAYKAVAGTLMAKLAKKMTEEGFIDGAVTSITNSGGDALKIETTSLAILAWLRDDTYTEQVERSILWLSERCKGGRFGSTQSTVLALKAIVEYDKARSTPKAPGSLVLMVDGKQVGEPVSFDEETKGAIRLPDLADKLTAGEHTIAVMMADGSKMPYTIAIDFFAEKPASSEACKLRISTRLNVFAPADATAPVVTEGETTEINVSVKNVTKDGLPTPLAIVGIPGGLEPSYDQLKELVKAGTIAAFEVKGRDVVLYWRGLKPEQTVELSIRCVAAVPGTYTGPASRAYLYYTDEHKQWADGLTVQITPRDQE